MPTQHEYTADIAWTGDRGEGTATYRGYDRTWRITTPGVPPIDCSNDPLLGGDPARANPETLLLSSLSACHMLWYLHLASAARIVVRGYRDSPVGVGESGPRGEGRFLRATLRPTITLDKGADVALADDLHHRVHEYCFIARLVNFPVGYDARYIEI